MAENRKKITPVTQDSLFTLLPETAVGGESPPCVAGFLLAAGN